MDALTITLPEELNISEVTHFHTSIVDKLSQLAPQQQININASELRRIDTAGMQLLVALISEASTQTNKLTWQNPSDSLTQCAAHLGLSDILLTTNS